MLRNSFAGIINKSKNARMVSRLSIAYRLYKWIFVILEKLLFSRYVYISCLDHPVFSLLATGYPGPGAVPGILAAHTPVPDFGYCGRWGVCPVKRDYYTAGENAAAALNPIIYNTREHSRHSKKLHIKPRNQ